MTRELNPEAICKNCPYYVHGGLCQRYPKNRNVAIYGLCGEHPEYFLPEPQEDPGPIYFVNPGNINIDDLENVLGPNDKIVRCMNFTTYQAKVTTEPLKEPEPEPTPEHEPEPDDREHRTYAFFPRSGSKKHTCGTCKHWDKNHTRIGEGRCLHPLTIGVLNTSTFAACTRYDELHGNALNDDRTKDLDTTKKP